MEDPKYEDLTPLNHVIWFAMIWSNTTTAFHNVLLNRCPTNLRTKAGSHGDWLYKLGWWKKTTLILVWAFVGKTIWTNGLRCAISLPCEKGLLKQYVTKGVWGYLSLEPMRSQGGWRWYDGMRKRKKGNGCPFSRNSSSIQLRKLPVFHAAFRRSTLVQSFYLITSNHLETK